MPHRFWMQWVTMGTIALLCTPTHSAAQVEAGDWSRIIQPRQCLPNRPCPPRTGLVWDSSNAFPRYPEVMAAVGIGGEVVLAFRVNEAGVVESGSIAILRTSNQAFVQTSVDRVSRWRFAVDGEGRPSGPIIVEVQLTFAHMGMCPDNIRRNATGWGRFNQFVVTTCSVRIPRDQLQRRPG